MKWIGISGSWRRSNGEIVSDVRAETEKIISKGDGIVTGGALGVDYVATETVLRLVNNDSQIRVILPTSLERYAQHYRNRASEGVIAHEQAELLIEQLEAVKDLGSAALIEMDYEFVDKTSYYARNTEVIDMADEILAFQVNASEGTQDAINKAKENNIPVKVRLYEIID